VANNKTDDYIVKVVDDLIRLPKISEADLDKAERDIRTSIDPLPSVRLVDATVVQAASAILKSRTYC
jgi:hypothetical protein